MNKLLLLMVFILFFCLITPSSSFAAEKGITFVPDRRRPQKSAIPNRYYFVLWVLSIEGIGVLPGFVGSIANIMDSGTNAAGINFRNGRFHIEAIGIDDLFALGNYKSWASLTLSGGQTDIEYWSWTPMRWVGIPAALLYR